MNVPASTVDAKISKFLQSIASRVGGVIVGDRAGDGAVVAQMGNGSSGSRLEFVLYFSHIESVEQEPTNYVAGEDLHGRWGQAAAHGSVGTG